jgi:2-iminobutanoate/2-iminopropanoate deaminase
MVADYPRIEHQGGMRPMPLQLVEHVEPKDCFKGNVPLSLAVKAGAHVFVSGIPGYDPNGTLAVGDFPAQMKQVMENITAILEASGTGWHRVVRTKVYLTRKNDFDDMNRIYAAYFPDGKFPARTTIYVRALPKPEFLLEIECDAVLA